MQPPRASFAEAFDQHREMVWALCYRMTGTAADADDLVQETFARAIEHPPPKNDPPSTWRPWLVRIAVNLARDHLRRRKRRPYVGPWLPEPIAIDLDAPDVAPNDAASADTEARYASIESVSFAFLIALEALTPQQRAVLLLRDVFDYSVRETAEALALSEPNVKTTHHRARAAMRGYDVSRTIPSPALQAKTQAALERFLTGLVSEDVAAIEATLAEDVLAMSDGAGEFTTARVPVSGRHKVALFFRNITRDGAASGRFALRVLNGMPALVAELTANAARPGSGLAPRTVLLLDINEGGQIRRLYSIVASGKLARVPSV